MCKYIKSEKSLLFLSVAYLGNDVSNDVSPFGKYSIYKYIKSYIVTIFKEAIKNGM